MAPAFQLLGEDEGKPVWVENSEARGETVIVCEHGGNLIPKRLGTLGLEREVLQRHIAWDPGALALARRIAASLDAELYHQRFSRLVYDCNRPPEAESATPSKSEIYSIPGNIGIRPDQRNARIEEIYRPFRDGLSSLIQRRVAAGKATTLVTVHSFTPVYLGKTRDVEVGILHDRDSRLADAMIAEADRMQTDYVVRRNEPYGPADGVTHTLVEHGLANGLPNVMIEVRNDLLEDEDGQTAMAAFLTNLIKESRAVL